MSVEFTPNQVNEIRYLNNKQNVCANLEYNRTTQTIEVNYSNKRLIFTPKANREKMEEFWMNLVYSSLEKKLKDLNEVLRDMRDQFQIKKL